MSQFTIEPRGEGRAILGGTGRLNAVAAPAFRALVGEATASGLTRIVVDLSGISFIDSTGLGALVGALKTARQAGGDLRIAAPTAQVTMVLELSNMDRVFRTYDSADDALVFGAATGNRH